MLDGWLAQLDTGEGWSAEDQALNDWECSPWQRLERRVAEDGRRIILAVACLGQVAVALDAESGTLRCGTTLVQTMELGGGGRETRIRWVRREEPGRWVWRATDGQTAWEVVTPPGEPLHRHLSV